jgi:hypothetical protein
MTARTADEFRPSAGGPIPRGNGRGPLLRGRIISLADACPVTITNVPTFARPEPLRSAGLPHSIQEPRAHQSPSRVIRSFPSSRG